LLVIHRRFNHSAAAQQRKAQQQAPPAEGQRPMKVRGKMAAYLALHHDQREELAVQHFAKAWQDLVKSEKASANGRM